MKDHKIVNMNQPIGSTTNFEVGKKETKENIIEEFDKKYPIIDWRGSPARDEIKRFLLYVLSLQKQEIVKEVEKLQNEFADNLETEFTKGWSSALEEAKVKILLTP